MKNGDLKAICPAKHATSGLGFWKLFRRMDVYEDLDVGQETGFTFRVGKGANKVPLHIRFYKEDVDTCSVYLFTPSAEFAQLVREQL